MSDLRALPQAGAYQCVVVDPPWLHISRSPKGQTSRSPSHHYSTMSLDEIKALPVAEIMAKNAFCFLWTTWPHMEVTFDVIRAWGLRYSSSFLVWAKLNPRAVDEMFLTERSFSVGMGYTSRKGTEILLLCRKGQPKRQSKAIRELLIAARRQHSRKPDESYRRIEAFCSGPRADIFTREVRDGWDAFGNEVEKFAGPVIFPDPEPTGPVPSTQMFPRFTVLPGVDEPDEGVEAPAFLRRLAGAS